MGAGKARAVESAINRWKRGEVIEMLASESSEIYSQSTRRADAQPLALTSPCEGGNTAGTP